MTRLMTLSQFTLPVLIMGVLVVGCGESTATKATPIELSPDGKIEKPEQLYPQWMIYWHNQQIESALSLYDFEAMATAHIAPQTTVELIATVSKALRRSEESHLLLHQPSHFDSLNIQAATDHHYVKATVTGTVQYPDGLHEPLSFTAINTPEGWRFSSSPLAEKPATDSTD